MASERIRVEVEKIIKALRGLGDEDSLDLAVDLDEQVRGNTDAEFATWITANDHGYEVFLEAAVSVRVAANQECRWTELGRESRFAVTAVERVRLFADEELRRLEAATARRNAIAPPAFGKLRLVPKVAQQKMPIASADGQHLVFVDAPSSQRSGTIPCPPSGGRAA